MHTKLSTHNPPSRLKWWDGLWCLLLASYILLGMSSTSFHGDEGMQIYTSHDYTTAFIEGDASRLTTQPPYAIDSDAQLRILNGTLNRYLIGLIWHISGHSASELPQAPGWSWGMTYEQNVEVGYRLSPQLMDLSRLPSTVFLVLASVVMFALGHLLSGRLGAYVASALFVLNPIILLNGRRATQEGTLLFFGLLTVYLGLVWARQRTAGQKPSLWLWLALIVVGALAILSKHTGIIFVAATFLTIFLVECDLFWRFRNGRDFALTFGACLVSAGVILALFIAFSPALWNDPLARLQDLLAVRTEVLEIQVAIMPDAPTPLSERLISLWTYPFTQPTQHFELPSWGESALFMSEVNTARQSIWYGVEWGMFFGSVWMMLALIGIVMMVRHLNAQPWRVGVLILLGLVIGSLIVNPLPWQRYYLLYIPLIALLAGMGFAGLITAFQRRQVKPSARGILKS